MKTDIAKNALKKLMYFQSTSIGLLVILVLIISGCDRGNIASVSNDVQPESIFRGDIPNIRYQVSYDQEYLYFSNLWPQDKVASLMSADESDYHWLLEHYEATHEMYGFDENGDMISTSEYLEGGDADTPIPPEIVAEVMEIAPAPGEEQIPIVKTEMRDGFIRYFSKNGSLINEYEYDPSEYRIDPAYLDSLAIFLEEPEDPSARVSQVLEELRNEGVAFKEDANGLYIMYEQNVIGDQWAASEQLWLEKATGNIIRSVDLTPDGKVLSDTWLSYKTIGGISLKEHSYTLNYGELDGEWRLLGRSVINRNNISINLK